MTRAEWWTKHVLGGFWASFGSVWAVFLKSIWQRWKAFRQSLSLDMWLREVFFGALLSTFNYRQSGPRESVEVSYVKIYGWPKWLKRRTNYPGPKWPRPEVVIHPDRLFCFGDIMAMSVLKSVQFGAKLALSDKVNVRLNKLVGLLYVSFS